VKTAVLLMAYGTPRHRDEIEPYYTDIRRGRPPTPEQLADLVRREPKLNAPACKRRSTGDHPAATKSCSG
jgi:protoheme ferro-lyase